MANGTPSWWQRILYSLSAIALGAILTWFAWQTVTQLSDDAFRNDGPRVTPSILARELALQKAEILAVLPPQEYRDRIAAVEIGQRRNEVKLERILAILEGRPFTNLNNP